MTDGPAGGGDAAGLAAPLPLHDDDPERVGPWRLLGRLGAGGTATVYLGRNRTGTTAAVKVVHAHLLADPSALGRFRREVAVLGTVRSPAVARILDADVDGRPPWLASEFVAGAPLGGVVASGGALGFAAWSGLAVRLLDGLAALHAVGVVHRDLSPHNIVMSPDGPRIIDFGLALGTTSTRVTRTETVSGTAGFMSPEQVSGERVTAAADVFAAGCVLALAATGRPPFGRGTAQEVWRRPLTEPIDVDGVPARQRRFLEALTAREPSSRPSAAAAAAEWAEVAELSVTLPALGPLTQAARTQRATRAETETGTPAPAAAAAAAPPPPRPTSTPPPAAPRGGARPEPAGPRTRRARQRTTVPVAVGALLVGLAAGAGVATALGPGAGTTPAASAAPRSSASPVTTTEASSTSSSTPTAPSPTAPSPTAPTPAPPSPSALSPTAPAAAVQSATGVAVVTSEAAAPTSTPLAAASSSTSPSASGAAVVAGVPSGDPTTSAQLRVMQVAAMARSYDFPGGSARVLSVVPADHATTSGSVTVSISADFNHTFNGPPGYSLEIRTRGMGATEAHYSTCLYVAASTSKTVVVPALSDTAMARWTSISVELDTDPHCTYLDPSLPPGTEL